MTINRSFVNTRRCRSRSRIDLMRHCLTADSIAYLLSDATKFDSGSSVLLDALQQELSKLGWVEGGNINFEYRFAEQKNERLPDLAAELVRLKVDLIVVVSTPPALAAKNATATIPIVMTNVGDPVGAGLIASLARPRGNVTGLASLTPELSTKRLEVSKTRSPSSPELDFSSRLA